MRGVPPKSLAVHIALLAQTRHAGDPISLVTIRPQDFFPRVGRTAHLLPTLITHALDDFEAPPFALNSVFNWAAAVHHQGFHLTKVALE